MASVGPHPESQEAPAQAPPTGMEKKLRKPRRRSEPGHQGPGCRAVVVNLDVWGWPRGLGSRVTKPGDCEPVRPRPSSRVDAEQGRGRWARGRFFLESSEGPVWRKGKTQSMNPTPPAACTPTVCLPEASATLQLMSLCFSGGDSSLTSPFHQKWVEVRPQALRTVGVAGVKGRWQVQRL